MKHVTYSEKSLLTGDAIADLLMQYATLLGQRGITDSVTVSALRTDGNGSDATFLLGPGIVLMVESTHTDLPEPDNTGAERYITDRIDEITQPHNVVPTEDAAVELPPDF